MQKIRVDGGSKDSVETDGRKDHSCDHPIWEDTWDASPPNLEIMGTPSVFGPPTFATGCFFRWVLWEAHSASPDLLANFKGRKEEYGREWVEHKWSNNGRRERDGRRKERGLAFAPREVHSNFSAVVAPTGRTRPTAVFCPLTWSVGTNLIHGEKCVISRDVSENMPNFTENSGKEFQKFTENSPAPRTLFRGAMLMQTKKSVE